MNFAKCLILLGVWWLIGSAQPSMGQAPLQTRSSGNQAIGVARKLPPETLARLQAMSLPQPVSRLVAEFARIQTAHLRASLAVTGPDLPKDLQGVRTSYEYWGKGSLFHIRAPIDPRLGLSYVTDVAFNGEVWQVVTQGRTSITALSLDRTDHLSTPTFIDNPLFLPLFFLSPADSELCPLCELRLSYLASLQSDQASAAASTASSASSNGSFAVTGGRGAKQNVQFQVYRDGEGRTTKIDRIEDGKTLDSLTLADYQPVSGVTFEFPRHLTLVRNDEKGAAWVTLDFLVNTLELNVPVAAANFVIPAASVDRIWDGDQKAWLKTDLAIRPCHHAKPTTGTGRCRCANQLAW
jgi:hypothetical protein